VNPAAPAVVPQPPAARRPVPAKPEQAAVRKLMREVFTAQLADRSAAARRKLAEALLTQAAKSPDAPVDQFVLWAAAIEAGAEAGDLPAALTAGERMAAAFEVDSLALQAEIALKVAPPADAPASAAANVRAGLALVARLTDAENYAAAAKVCAALPRLAGGNAALRAEVQGRQRDVAAARAAAERVARQLEKLKAAPDDPAANLDVGRYYCLKRSDWSRGLPLLARGADAKLKAIAGRELAGAKDADARAALGDAWWDLAQAAAAADKQPMRVRAAAWYAEAAPGLKGLARTKVEQRLAEADAALPRVEILGTMTGGNGPGADGVVTLRGDERITSAEPYATPVSSRIVAQTESTNIRIDFGRVAVCFNWEASKDVTFVNYGQSPNPADTIARWQREKNQATSPDLAVPAGKSVTVFAGRVPENQWVTIDLDVRRDSVTLTVDGQRRAEFKLDASDLKAPVSIYAHGSTIRVKSVQVRGPAQRQAPGNG
jgi:SWI/SNF-related matrix-associated actin-dependent regulator 1 of chromatin subfamily A